MTVASLLTKALSGQLAGARRRFADGLTRTILRRTQLQGDEDPALPPFHEIGSLPEYREYRGRMAAVERKRRLIETLLAAEQEPFRYAGYNALIGCEVEFLVDYQFSYEGVDGLLLPNYRERLLCSVTNLNNRQRGVLLAMQHLIGLRLWRARIYATERLTPFFAFLQRRFPGATGSEYLGGAVAPGAERDGIRNEDLTALTFGDDSFDVVVTNDVLEHVPRFDKAYRELLRVLAPGGTLLVTVPFVAAQYDHVIRAVVKPSGGVEHLLPPDYHGDPLRPEGALCYQYFGWKILDDLRSVGFQKAGALFYWSLYHGLLGQDQVIFFARKD